MELAAALHHSSFVGAGPETYDAPRSQRTANSRVDSVYFDLYDEYTEGAQPDRIATLSGPHARVQRRIVEQIVESLWCLFSTILRRRRWKQLPDVLQFFDALMPDPEQVIEVPKILPEDVPVRASVRVTQLAEQLVEVPTNPGNALAVVATQTLGWFAPHDIQVPEQAIEVSKILLDDVPVRIPVRVTQLVEQLVEVPTIISYSSLRRTTEQHVDIPVPRRGGRHPGLQGFPSSKKRISERIVEQIVDPVSSGRLLGSLPGQGSSSSHSPARAYDALDAPGEGFFSHFSPN